MDAIPLIRKLAPGTKIIGVSAHRQPAYAKKMIQLGAKGYVTKKSSSQEMLVAIDEVMKGDTYVCTEIKNMVSAYIFFNEGKFRDAQTLSLREIEIIQLIKEGSSSKEIAINLHLLYEQ